MNILNANQNVIKNPKIPKNINIAIIKPILKDINKNTDDFNNIFINKLYFSLIYQWDITFYFADNLRYSLFGLFYLRVFSFKFQWDHNRIYPQLDL